MGKSDQDRRRVNPLTAAEMAWVEKLESLMKAMPKRLLLVECADSLFVVDKAAAQHTEMHDGGARAAGIVLADITSSVCKVTSVSG